MEKTDFDERYFTLRASLLYINKLQPMFRASSLDSENRSDNNPLAQVLEQEATLMQ